MGRKGLAKNKLWVGALALHLALLAWPAFVTAAPTAAIPEKKSCFDLLDFDLYERPYHDDYSADEHVTHFWNLHQRFGFIRQGEATYLIAKDQLMAAILIDDLQLAFGRTLTADSLNSPHIDGIDEGVVTNITSLLPPSVAELQGVSPLDGPNCWNFCLYEKISSGLYFTAADEFSHWLSSPLAEKRVARKQLRPGDIIALRRSRPNVGDFREAHGAIYVSPRLVLTKNGTASQNPYRISDINEMYNTYYPNSANTVEVYNLQSFDAYLAAHPTIKSEILLSTLEKIRALEQKMTVIYLVQNTSSWTAEQLGDFESQKRNFRRESQLFTTELRSVAAAEQARINADDSINPEDRGILSSIWVGLALRAQSLDLNK